jgi:chemotaxis protein CheD
MERIFLLPGEFRVSEGPELIETLLGSCVAVCLYNVKNSQAAMNHFLQSSPPKVGDHDIGYYGLTSTEHIIGMLMKSDPIASHYTARIYGGAAVLKTSGQANIGLDNIEIARSVLSASRIRVVQEQVGGDRGRRIKFDTATNTVACRFAGDTRKSKKKGD